MAAAELPEMPNGPIMELHGQRKRFHVPHGLKPLLEEITREILRYQPDDIYTFLTSYMELKLEKRATSEQKHRKSWEWRRWSSDGSSTLSKDELEEFLGEFSVSKNEADQYATKIQAAFRGHQARKSLHDHGINLSSEIRKSQEKRRWSWEGGTTTKSPTEELGEFLEELQVGFDEANKYATKIQAAFRGHQARRSLGSQGIVVIPPNMKRVSIKPEEAKPKDDAPPPPPEAGGHEIEIKKSGKISINDVPSVKIIDDAPSFSDIKMDEDSPPEPPSDEPPHTEQPHNDETKASVLSIHPSKTESVAKTGSTASVKKP